MSVPVLVLLAELLEVAPIPALLVNSFKRFKPQITQNKHPNHPEPGHPANGASGTFVQPRLQGVCYLSACHIHTRRIRVRIPALRSNHGGQYIPKPSQPTARANATGNISFHGESHIYVTSDPRTLLYRCTDHKN